GYRTRQLVIDQYLRMQYRYFASQVLATEGLSFFARPSVLHSSPSGAALRLSLTPEAAPPSGRTGNAAQQAESPQRTRDTALGLPEARAGHLAVSAPPRADATVPGGRGRASSGRRRQRRTPKQVPPK